MENQEEQEIVLMRADGNTFKTALDRMEEDCEIQANILSDKVERKRIRKAKWVAWWKKWVPQIWSGIQVLGIIAAVAILLYFLFWIALIAIGLAAAGSREQRAQGQYYNQQRSDRPTANPKYWKR